MKRGKDLPLMAREEITTMNRSAGLSPKRISEKFDSMTVENRKAFNNEGFDLEQKEITY